MGAVRLGVLGFAHGHVGTYLERWRKGPELGVEVVAGWDHDEKRAADSCGKHGLKRAASAEELVREDGLDAVAIGAETSRHAELVELAAAAGKAVVLQKPMALELAEADRIVAAVERHQVPFTMAWQMRVDPHNLRARELLAEGRLGRVFMVRRRHCLCTQLWKDFDKAWHVQPALNRDIFADDAAHAIDFVYWLLGMPLSVSAEIGTALNPRIPNDNGIAVFRYPEGRLAEVSCTFVAVAGENTLEILGENGIIVGNYGDVPSCMIPRPAGGIQLKWYLHETGQWATSDLPDILSQGERIAGLAAPLAGFLHGRRPPVASAREGRDVLKMTLACLESAAAGRRVPLGAAEDR
jgi:predicted dehydrogenase